MESSLPTAQTGKGDQVFSVHAHRMRKTLPLFPACFVGPFCGLRTWEARSAGAVCARTGRRSKSHGCSKQLFRVVCATVFTANRTLDVFAARSVLARASPKGEVGGDKRGRGFLDVTPLERGNYAPFFRVLLRFLLWAFLMVGVVESGLPVAFIAAGLALFRPVVPSAMSLGGPTSSFKRIIVLVVYQS